MHVLIINATEDWKAMLQYHLGTIMHIQEEVEFVHLQVLQISLKSKQSYNND